MRHTRKLLAEFTRQWPHGPVTWVIADTVDLFGEHAAHCQILGDLEHLHPVEAYQTGLWQQTLPDDAHWASLPQREVHPARSLMNQVVKDAVQERDAVILLAGDGQHLDEWATVLRSQPSAIVWIGSSSSPPQRSDLTMPRLDMPPGSRSVRARCQELLNKLEPQHPSTWITRKTLLVSAALLGTFLVPLLCGVMLLPANELKVETVSDFFRIAAAALAANQELAAWQLFASWNSLTLPSPWLALSPPGTITSILDALLVELGMIACYTYVQRQWGGWARAQVLELSGNESPTRTRWANWLYQCTSVMAVADLLQNFATWLCLSIDSTSRLPAAEYVAAFFMSAASLAMWTAFAGCYALLAWGLWAALHTREAPDH